MKPAWRVSWPIEIGTATCTQFQDHPTEMQAKEHETRVREAGGYSGTFVLTFQITTQ